MAKATTNWGLERRVAIENRILDYLNTKEESSSLSIILADVFLRPIIQDVPFEISFPPALTGWNRLRFELRRLPYEIRHLWRVWRRHVSEEQIEQYLLELLREQRVHYSPATMRYSRKLG